MIEHIIVEGPAESLKMVSKKSLSKDSFKMWEEKNKI